MTSIHKVRRKLRTPQTYERSSAADTIRRAIRDDLALKSLAPAYRMDVTAGPVFAMNHAVRERRLPTFARNSLSGRHDGARLLSME